MFSKYFYLSFVIAFDLPLIPFKCVPHMFIFNEFRLFGTDNARYLSKNTVIHKLKQKKNNAIFFRPTKYKINAQQNLSNPLTKGVGGRKWSHVRVSLAGVVSKAFLVPKYG
jgi:hypothetical protein